MEQKVLDTELQRVAELLAAQKKVRVKISINPLNPDDRTVPVCVNGYSFFILRGQTVEVPQTVADLLAGAAYI